MFDLLSSDTNGPLKLFIANGLVFVQGIFIVTDCESGFNKFITFSN